MAQPTLPKASFSQYSSSKDHLVGSTSHKKKTRRKTENSDVLISAVISSYLLTHLHQVLQRAEYGATKEGRASQASNFAQLRKVLCMDARSMEDASASGMNEGNQEQFNDSTIEPKAA